jgi:hypothetical protein
MQPLRLLFGQLDLGADHSIMLSLDAYMM